MQRRTLLQASVATAATLAAPMIKAQTLPSGPIRIVVGFPPGGGTDALARVLAQKLQILWGTTIVIEAGTSIELKVGGSSIKIEAAKITIKSAEIEVKADANIKIDAGAMMDVKSGAVMTVSGALVKIN